MMEHRLRIPVPNDMQAGVFAAALPVTKAEAASQFGTLTASGWHTATVPMRLFITDDAGRFSRRARADGARKQ